ncbi:MAG: PQQ-binding-like beta-propeller repeat protein [Planctomycetota bacterium]|nr:PQQ-binding-like beta-propeller repeat protein [Planctomycetota bacterium]
MTIKCCRSYIAGLTFCGTVLAITNISNGDDWSRFRGPNGTGISKETNLPTQWNDKTNLKWAVDLPGPGSSSPIVSGDKVFVACYSGYGLSRENPGRIQDLKRHLVCISATDGKVIWQKDVPADSPEDAYFGYLTEHGYATNTPVTDGESVFAFFGKSGVVAFDMKGNQLWKKNVGKSSSMKKWGSAASPIVYKDWVIVNASEESNSIRALDKKTGEEAWKAAGSRLNLAYNTPVFMESNGRTDLLISMPYEVWGMNPDTGKLRWYVRLYLDGNITPSILVDNQMAYVMGGFRSKGALAIRGGGKGDITRTHLAWSTAAFSSYVPSPVVVNGYMFWASEQGIAYCVEAGTGKVVYKERLQGQSRGGGRPFYASVVYGDGNIYAVSRTRGTYVFKASPQFEQVSQNILQDNSDFNASPAISNGRIFIRSNKSLYCVGK